MGQQAPVNTVPDGVNCEMRQHAQEAVQRLCVNAITSPTRGSDTCRVSHPQGVLKSPTNPESDYFFSCL